VATTEDQLRTQLGIPPTTTAKQVIILASTSHLDWDWLSTFYGYYSTTQTFDFTDYAVRDIFTNATTYLNANKNNAGQTCTTSNPTQPPPYYYSIAEVGYLQEFASDQAATFKTLQGVGDLLRIVGGGITSPDNLLPHGETLLRNFVIANAWLLSNFPAPNGLPPLPPLQQVWTPDDFGHDSQFPILMEAMGLQGVGFSRIPGDPQQYWTFGQPNSGISGGPDVAAWLLVFGDSNKQNLGTDFIWQASDGSTTLAHFMQAGYFQGAGISGTADIQTYYNTNKGASVTPYIFVPVGVDFSLPVEDLVQFACQWNAANLATTGVYAVAATFDHYIQLVSFHQDKLLTRSSKPDMSTTFPFVPAPYWTGCYASRPEIKIRHQKATRLLLGAELFSVIANFLSVPEQAFQRDRSRPAGNN
jgi:alpha-mannosidase